MIVDRKINEIASILNVNEPKDVGLMRGKGGVILALHQYSKICSEIDVADTINSRISAMVDQLEKESQTFTFARGLAGVGWLLLYCSKENLIDLPTALLEQIDRQLSRTLQQEIALNNFDYLHGYLGIGLYSLKRQSQAVNRQIIKALEDASEKEQTYCRWKTTDRKTKTELYNLGLSHGMSSIASYLVYCIKGSIERERCADLLFSSIRFLLNNKLDPDQYHSMFPSSVYMDGRQPLNSRLAWCYGDLGIGTMLWSAGDTLGVNKWKELATEIYDFNLSRRDFENTAIIDAGFCHGSSGIAYLYNKMASRTKSPKFLDAGKFWTADTLARSSFVDGYAGYKSFFGAHGWTNELGLLEGISGTMLSLLYYLKSEEMDTSWDELLLLN